MTTKPMVDDIRWLALCASKGRESPDPNTKVGCVIVGPDRSVRSEACNTFPNGVLGGIEERTEAPLKYTWIEHAERNAIYLAARRGISTEGCTMVVDLTPCVECARAIIQAGVAQMVINGDRSAEYRGDRYSAEHSTALAMLAEAGIAVRFVSPGLEQHECAGHQAKVRSEMARLAMFVDGWNFYWSLVNADIKPYGWCNFAQLAQQQTGLPNATVNVKYFTSEDKPNPDKIFDRQRPTWWRALRYLGVQIVEGEFRSTDSEVEQQIREDRKKWREKQTDIALASHMIADCNLIEPDPDRPGVWLWTPGYDEAVLLSQDSDYVPAAKILVSEPFRRRLHVLLPPSSDAAQANALQIWKPLSGPNLHVVQLTKADLAKALLPQFVTDAHGEKVKCHHSWMWREKHENLQLLRTPAAKNPGKPP